MKKINTILVPVDFSNASKAVAEYAVLFAKQFKAKLHIIHVVETLDDYTGIYVPHISLDSVMNEIEQAAKKELNKYCNEYFEGIVDYEFQLLQGDVSKQVLSILQEKKHDLVIIGTHGTSALDHLFFGSTAERVVKKAECPVMTVKVTE